MRKSWVGYFRRIAAVCFVGGATAWSSAMCYAQVAADNATDPAYADGWTAGDNGGFGFGPWDFTLTYHSPVQQAINSTSPYNQLGTAWTLYNPEGSPQATDLGQAGRAIVGNLQPGQTISMKVDNPTERFFFRGYTIRLNTGGGNTVFNGTPRSRLSIGTFEYFPQTPSGKWFAGDTNPPFLDNDTDQGMQIDVTLTGVDTYSLTMTPLDNPANAFTSTGTLAEPAGSVIDWIEFEMYNTDSDFYPMVVPDPQPTDFYFTDLRIVTAGSRWNVDANGNWSEAANWSGGVPNAAGAKAVFGNIITAPRTVTVNTAITVGEIELDHSSAYTLAGSNAITLDVASGNAQINVITGSHTISAPVTLSDNTLIAVAGAAGNLSITGALSASGVSLTKTGAGRLTANNVRATGLAIDAGTVAIAPNGTNAGTSNLGALTIGGVTDAWTARLDLNNNDAVVRSTAATKAADVARLYNQLEQGYADGNWNGQGITSSAAANNTNLDTGLALVDNAALGRTDFSGQTVNADSILLKYTYYGDIDMNGQVDGEDLTTFALNFGQTTGKTQVDGDIDFNGRVDGEDLTVFALNFNKGIGNPLSTGSVQAVPEPQTIGLAVIGLGALVTCACARRRL